MRGCAGSGVVGRGWGEGRAEEGGGENLSVKHE